jgi:hypothetical protein
MRSKTFDWMNTANFLSMITVRQDSEYGGVVMIAFFSLFQPQVAPGPKMATGDW